LKKGGYNDYLVVGGRAPIWLYVPLCNMFGHIYKSIMIFDPKIRKCIIGKIRDEEERYFVKGLAMSYLDMLYDNRKKVRDFGDELWEENSTKY